MTQPSFVWLCLLYHNLLFPSHDNGAPTIVCVLTVDGVIAKQVPPHLVELLEEAIGAMHDMGEMDDGPEDW